VSIFTTPNSPTGTPSQFEIAFYSVNPAANTTDHIIPCVQFLSNTIGQGGMSGLLYVFDFGQGWQAAPGLTPASFIGCDGQVAWAFSLH
jgi:hypothetical protein